MAGNRNRSRSNRSGGNSMGTGLLNNARRTMQNRTNRVDAATRAATEGRNPNNAGRVRNKVSGDRGTRTRRGNSNRNRNR